MDYILLILLIWIAVWQLLLTDIISKNQSFIIKQIEELKNLIKDINYD